MESVNNLRRHFDMPAITTDVIVGFPGETEEDFQESYDFCKAVDFYEMHVFKYSKRQGTRAAVMEGQLTEAKKAQRSDQMLLLEEGMSEGYRKQFLGKTISVLFEEQIVEEGITYQIGHSKEYIKVAVATDKSLENQVRDVIPAAFLKKDMMVGNLAR